MSKEHRLLPRESKGVALAAPVNFLLNCSQHALQDFALARYAGAADSRRAMHAALDRLVQETALAMLADWFRSIDPHDLKLALENPDDIDTIIQQAQEQIRTRQRSEEEIEAESAPLQCLPPGAAHLAAAVRYAERNIAEGKCAVCPKPLDRNSVRYCTKHLAAARARDQRKKALSVPGSTEYLYAGETPSTHGRQPGTLASLAVNREKASRALLAELGIPPESAAVSLKAAIEALLKTMPHSKADAMTQAQLFEKAGVVTKTTGQRALQQLLYTKEIRRFGKGGPLDPYRYFKSGEEPTETRKPKHLSRTKQNSALLKVMRGEEASEE